MLKSPAIKQYFRHKRDTNANVQNIQRNILLPQPYLHFILSAKATTDSSGSFWTWNVGERLVVYLAVCDLFFSISHSLDHAYMMATKINPPVSIR